MKFNKHFLTAVVLLASVTSLAACGQSSSKQSSHAATTHSSSKPVSKSTSSQAASSNQADSIESSSASENANTDTAASSTSSQTARATAVNTEAVSQRDFSSLAGHWSDDQGNRLNITADGHVTDSKDGVTRTLVPVGLTPNKTAYGNIQNTDGSTYAGYEVYPAGAKSSDGSTVTQVDRIQTSVKQGDPTFTYHRNN